MPEPFELDCLAAAAADPLRAFHADVVQAHFERGGKTRSSGDAFVVERVLFDHRLLPGPAAALQYRVVDAGGSPRERGAEAKSRRKKNRRRPKMAHGGAASPSVARRRRGGG